MKSLAFILTIVSLLGLNVSCTDRNGEKEVLEKAGEDVSEGVEEMGDEIEDAAE